MDIVARIDRAALLYRIYRILYYYPDLTAYAISRELFYIHEIDVSDKQISRILKEESWVRITKRGAFNPTYAIDDSEYTPFRFMLDESIRKNEGLLAGRPTDGLLSIDENGWESDPYPTTGEKGEKNEKEEKRKE